MYYIRNTIIDYRLLFNLKLNYCEYFLTNIFIIKILVVETFILLGSQSNYQNVLIAKLVREFAEYLKISKF